MRFFSDHDLMFIIRVNDVFRRFSSNDAAKFSVFLPILGPLAWSMWWTSPGSDNPNLNQGFSKIYGIYGSDQFFNVQVFQISMIHEMGLRNLIHIRVYIYNRFMDPCPWWQGLLSTSEFRLSQLSLHWPLGIWFRFSIWNPLTKLEEFSDLKNNAAMVGMIKHRKDNMIHSEVKKGGYAKILPRSNYLKLKNTIVSSTYKISTILLGFDPLRFTLWEISRSLRYVTHMSNRYELVDPIYLLRFIHQKSKYKSNS